jgi:hypothetical protein
MVVFLVNDIYYERVRLGEGRSRFTTSFRFLSRCVLRSTQDCDGDVDENPCEELGFIYQKHIGSSLVFGLASRILFWVLLFRHLKIAHFYFFKNTLSKVMIRSAKTNFVQLSSNS